MIKNTHMLTSGRTSGFLCPVPRNQNVGSTVAAMLKPFERPPHKKEDANRKQMTGFVHVRLPFSVNVNLKSLEKAIATSLVQVSLSGFVSAIIILELKTSSSLAFLTSLLSAIYLVVSIKREQATMRLP